MDELTRNAWLPEQLGWRLSAASSGRRWRAASTMAATAGEQINLLLN